MRHTFVRVRHGLRVVGLNSKYRNESSVDVLRAQTLYVVVTAIFGLWLAWDAAFVRLVLYAASADYWEHTATLTEWLRNFSTPGNPHVDDPSLSARYMPWFWLLTYAGIFFGLDAIQLMAISSVVNYLLIVVGLHVFLKAYFRDHWAPIIGFFAIFFFWGISWNWSNLYHLRSFFYVAGYPSTFVFGLSLFSLAVVLRMLRRDGSLIVLGALLCALSTLMFLCHPLTGVFGIVACGLLALTEPSESISTRLLILIILFVGTLLAEFWPYFSVWKISLGLYSVGQEQWFTAAESAGPLERFNSGAWKQIFYDPRLVLINLGPALLGLPACIWLAIRREHRFIVWGAVVMAIPYLLHLFVEVPLAHRFLLFVVTFFQLAIVTVILKFIDAWNMRPRPAYATHALGGSVSLIAVLLIFNVFLLAIEFSGFTLSAKTLQLMDKRANLPAETNVVELYTELTEPLPDDGVVLATPAIGWPLPTVKGKVVSIYHENPMLPDQLPRYIDTARFFDKTLTEPERAGVVKRYSASHLLLRGEPQTASLGAWLGRNARPVATVDEYQMYELLPTAVDAAPAVTGGSSATSVSSDSAAEIIVDSISELLSSDRDPEDEVQAADTPDTDIGAEPEPAAEPVVSRPPSETSGVGQAESKSGGFGAPISEPLIASPDGTPPAEPGAAERPAPAPAEDKSSSGQFGAPIQDPILDPERHGG